MKTLLLTPPEDRSWKTPTQPIGIASIAGTLDANNWDVKILDSYLYKLTRDQFRKEIRRSDADIFGVSCNVVNRFESFKAAKIIKEEHPNSLVVMGGPFPTFCYKEILEDFDFIDIVVRGEGEQPLLDIAEKKPLSEIKGISYRDHGKIRLNQFNPFIKDLNNLPPPAFHLLEMDKYPNFLLEDGLYLDKSRATKSYTANLMFGRGCPFNCVFCSSKNLWNRTYRIISPTKACEQVKYFLDKGINGFSFFDDHLLLDKKWFFEFSRLIREETDDIQYKCLSRVDSITREVADELYKSGCISVTLGVENGSDGVLKLMNKGITASIAENAVRLLYERGISLKAGMLINTPREKLSDIKTSLRFFKKLRNQYKLVTGPIPVPLQIYPGADLEKIAKNDKKLGTHFKWTRPYFEKRNLLLGSNPRVPIYENYRSELLYSFLIKEFLKMGELGAVRTMGKFLYNYIKSFRGSEWAN